MGAIARRRPVPPSVILSAAKNLFPGKILRCAQNDRRAAQTDLKTIVQPGRRFFAALRMTGPTLIVNVHQTIWTMPFSCATLPNEITNQNRECMCLRPVGTRGG